MNNNKNKNKTECVEIKCMTCIMSIIHEVLPS